LFVRPHRVDVSFLNLKKKKDWVFVPSDNPERAHMMKIAYDDGGRK
jgi:hypothetical protein